MIVKESYECVKSTFPRWEWKDLQNFSKVLKKRVLVNDSPRPPPKKAEIMVLVDGKNLIIRRIYLIKE